MRIHYSIYAHTQSEVHYKILKLCNSEFSFIPSIVCSRVISKNLPHINKTMFLLTYLLLPLVLTSGTTQGSVTKNRITVKVCKEKDKLSQVTISDKNIPIERTCSTVEMYNFRLTLRECKIVNFEKSWYQMDNLPIDYIDLSGNNVTEVTGEILNNLPISVNTMILAHNQIVKLKKGIRNMYIRRLDLDSNFISEIKKGTFENTKLRMLIIRNNKLKNTKFAATLPTTLKSLRLEKNRIIKISDGCFRKLQKLKNLSLGYNNITVIPANFSDGLSALENLDLGYNNIFRFDRHVLVNLRNIRVLNLQFNKIENLKAGVFVDFPKMEKLHLEGNNISKIENGCFNLTQLRYLDLSHNSLTRIDMAMFEGLVNLQTVVLAFNRITNTEIKSLFTSMRLNDLDTSNNPVMNLRESGRWLFEFMRNREQESQ